MNRTIYSLVLLPLLLSSAMGLEVNTDPECGVDSDQDGLVDCTDSDDDDDGLSDQEERAYGTDSKESDTDRDGLTDSMEISTTWPCTSSDSPSVAVCQSEATVPTLLVEVDSLVGYQPSAMALELAEESLRAVGIETFFWLDDPSEGGSAPLVEVAEMEALLSESRAATDGDSFSYYIHVFFGRYGEEGDHGTTHFSVPNDPTRGNHGNYPVPGFAGSFVWMQRVIDDFEANQSAFDGIGVSLDMLVARSFVHEIGHLIGCTHEGDNNGGVDFTNVMVLNSTLGSPSAFSEHWESQFAAGHPTFSEASREQMDLSFKGSVETGSSPMLRRFDLGPSDGPVAPGYVRVMEASAFAPDLAFGFLPPLPAIASTDGSDSGDARYSDFLRGDAEVTHPTRFRITNLGEHPIDLRFRLGAVLDTETNVRCEVVHPGRVTSFREGRIEAGGGFQETRPDLIVYPTVARNAFGYARTEVVLVCLDEDRHWDDAPIELVEIRKREP